jgi:hypothetical protein
MRVFLEKMFANNFRERGKKRDRGREIDRERDGERQR